MPHLHVASHIHALLGKGGGGGGYRVTCNQISTTLHKYQINFVVPPQNLFSEQ